MRMRGVRGVREVSVWFSFFRHCCFSVGTRCPMVLVWSFLVFVTLMDHSFGFAAGVVDKVKVMAIHKY